MGRLHLLTYPVTFACYQKAPSAAGEHEIVLLVPDHVAIYDNETTLKGQHYKCLEMVVWDMHTSAFSRNSLRCSAAAIKRTGECSNDGLGEATCTVFSNTKPYRAVSYSIQHERVEL